MMPTNREAEQWNKVAHMAAMRKVERARMEAIAKILAERKAKPEKPGQTRIF